MPSRALIRLIIGFDGYKGHYVTPCYTTSNTRHAK